MDEKGGILMGKLKEQMDKYIMMEVKGWMQKGALSSANRAD